MKKYYVNFPFECEGEIFDDMNEARAFYIECLEQGKQVEMLDEDGQVI